jgi:hypothetical protein
MWHYLYFWQNQHITFNVEKVAQKDLLLLHLSKMAKEHNCSLGENSPNLVTLILFCACD